MGETYASLHSTPHVKRVGPHMVGAPIVGCHLGGVIGALATYGACLDRRA